MIFNQTGGGINKPGITGIIWDEMYDTKYPSRIIYNFSGLTTVNLRMPAMEAQTENPFSYAKKIDIIADRIANGCFNHLDYIAGNVGGGGKVKISEVTYLETHSLDINEDNISNPVKIYIPSSVVTAESSVFGFPRIYNYNNVDIYCGYASIPSKWDINWNRTNFPVTWGVTEAAFDAM